MLPTHDLGGLLDVVATRDDLPIPTVDVLDANGLSDHRLLRWTAPLGRPCPLYTSMTSRPWRRLDAAAFRTALRSSQLCRPESWVGLGIDELAQLYDTEIVGILDRLVPTRTVRCRRRQGWICQKTSGGVGFFPLPPFPFPTSLFPPYIRFKLGPPPPFLPSCNFMSENFF